jgi:hypothetical protein
VVRQLQDERVIRVGLKFSARHAPPARVQSWRERWAHVRRKRTRGQ